MRSAAHVAKTRVGVQRNARRRRGGDDSHLLLPIVERLQLRRLLTAARDAPPLRSFAVRPVSSATCSGPPSVSISIGSAAGGKPSAIAAALKRSESESRYSSFSIVRSINSRHEDAPVRSSSPSLSLLEA